MTISAIARERKSCGCYVEPEKTEDGKAAAPCAKEECKSWARCLDAGQQGEVGFGEVGRLPYNNSNCEYKMLRGGF